MLTWAKATRAAMLLAGAAAIAVPGMAPARDKKQQQEEAKPTGPQLSPEFRKVALPVQTGLQNIRTLIQTRNFDAAGTALAPLNDQITAADAAAKTDDDRYFAQIFRLQFEDFKLQTQARGDVAAYQKGEAALVAPMKALVANPKTAAEQKASFAVRLGQIAYDAKDYAGAVALFEQARAAGSTDPNLLLDLARAKSESGDIAGGVGVLQQAIDAEQAAGRKAPESWYLYARARMSNANDVKGTLDWTRKLIAAYPTAKNWSESLLWFAFTSPTKLDKRERIDVFRLMRAAKAINDQDVYLEFAEDLFDVGLPNEAKAVIDEGRAAGKVPATGGRAAATYTESTGAIKNSGSVASLETKAKASPNGLTAAATGDGYLGEGNYAKAIELYKLALSKGGLTKPDEVLAHMAIAQAFSGDKAGAKASFAMMKSPVRIQIASFWTLWLDLPAATPAA